MAAAASHSRLCDTLATAMGAEGSVTLHLRETAVNQATATTTTMLMPHDIISVNGNNSRMALGPAMDTVGVGGRVGIGGDSGVGCGNAGANGGSTMGLVKIAAATAAYPDSGDMLADMLDSIQAAGTNIVLQGDWILRKITMSIFERKCANTHKTDENKQAC